MGFEEESVMACQIYKNPFFVQLVIFHVQTESYFFSFKAVEYHKQNGVLTL